MATEQAHRDEPERPWHQPAYLDPTACAADVEFLFTSVEAMQGAQSNTDGATTRERQDVQQRSDGESDCSRLLREPPPKI